MPTLLGIHSIVTRPGQLYQALKLCLKSAANHHPEITISLRHLGDFWISFADERPLANYPNGTRVVEQVMAANPYLIATFLERIEEGVRIDS